MIAQSTRRDGRTAHALLALMCVAFVVFSAEFVPRLTNVHFGDVEFTGWSGPLGSRILRGDRPYVDFVLPIPPGSFVVLALLEKLCGGPLLLQELGLNAYAMARTITAPKNAVVTAAATLATVIQLNKECAYDHTAQVVAWASVAAGMHALASTDDRHKNRLWVLAGFLSGFTLAFKQSTALGAIFGWVASLGYLALTDRRAAQPSGARRRELARYGRGVALGLSAVWLLLLVLGSTLRAFVQAVFLDASMLKGGAKTLAWNLMVYLFDFPSYAAPLGGIAAFVFIGYRLFVRGAGLRITDERERESPYRRWEVITVGALVVAAFVGGWLLLALDVRPYPGRVIGQIDRLKMLPPMTLVTLLGIFVAELVHLGPAAGTEAEHGAVGTGRSFNAAAMAAFASSLMHNTSAPEFRPFYDNNALIPLCFLSLFVLLDRADLRWLSAALLALFLFSIGGNKYFRAMTASVPIGTNGHFAWMRLNDRGFTMAIAAARARQLAAPEGTVLVLPEDVQFAALVGRPRPPILGAIVFVDQYAPRLAENDIRRLDEHPPKVIVVHPRRPAAWQRFFRIWSGKSGAERVVRHVLSDMIPKLYRRDSTFQTTFLYEPGKLDVYVRRDVPPTPGQRERTAREASEGTSEELDMLPDPDKPGGDVGTSLKEPNESKP
jgi:hypothetical protein